jgi:hypothetical protein
LLNGEKGNLSYCAETKCGTDGHTDISKTKCSPTRGDGGIKIITLLPNLRKKNYVIFKSLCFYLFSDFDYGLPDLNTDEYGNVNR